MALILRDISCEYASGTVMAARALSGVTLSVARGELVVVVGPTGSGKTTMLRAAAGLVPVVGGSILADDAPVLGPGSVKGAVGLVFQRPEAQFFALSVEEDCAFGPRNLGRSASEAREDVCDALRSVGLDPAVFGPREPWSLSGGEARRAALAGVLAMRPRYLLLDEPTAGLDATGRAAVVRVVLESRAEAGVMVVTHDPEEFLPHADRVLVLRAGSPVFAGDIGELLASISELASAGAVEPPPVVEALLEARRRGLRLDERITLDPDEAATMLATAARGGATP